MIFTLTIDTDNIATAGDMAACQRELATILHAAADLVARGAMSRELYAFNGNHCGSMTLTEDPEGL